MAKPPLTIPRPLHGASYDGPGGKVGQILAAARHLFLEQGYWCNTSMDSVAKRAGVSKATLYVRISRTTRTAWFADVVAWVARSRLNGSHRGDRG